MFLLLFKKKFMTNLEKYTDHNEKFYLKQPQCCLFYQVFLYHNSDKLISQVNC